MAWKIILKFSLGVEIVILPCTGVPCFFLCVYPMLLFFLFLKKLVPPIGMLNNPMNAVTTKFVRTSTNKVKCPVFVVRVSIQLDIYLKKLVLIFTNVFEKAGQGGISLYS
jgi:hypothetical protein